MQARQTLSSITSRTLLGMDEVIEQAKPDVQDAGDVHVTAASEHTGAERVEHRERQAQREEQEVEGCIVANVRTTSQPMGQVTADAGTDGAEHKGKEHAREETLTKHLSGSCKIVGTSFMCHLHIEAHAGSGAEAAEEPNGGADQTDAGTGMGAKTADHAGIDVLHHDVHHLCQHAGETEQGGKLDLC